MAIDQNVQKCLFDALYCDEEDEEEEQWGEIEEESEITLNKNIVDDNNNNYNILSLFPLLLSEQDLFWDDEELQSLFIKERETCIPKLNETAFLSLSRARKEAVEWILKINSHYGFSPLTAILAVNYFDRFLFGLCFHQKEKPWMMQLLSVACLSLAAKVEETHVPLLLDLQVEDAKYVFEAKTIQRMEVLVLSGLKWRMNIVTPLSFLDHIIGRLGLKSYIHWEFLMRSCENLLLSVILDPRFIHYLPSVLATATMLHFIHQVEPSNNSVVYENQLIGVLKISKEEVDDCYELISNYTGKKNPLKRKFSQLPSSPAPAGGGVMDHATFSSDNDGSNDSWASIASSSSSSSCISSSVPHHQPLFKNSKRVCHLNLNRVFVDSVGISPH